MTVGHAPLAIDRLLDVRTTKWHKQLPTTVQCRWHSRDAPANVCLWRPAAWTNTPQRREQKRNLIVLSGISEAETTNNKRLRSTFCIEAILQTRSIVRPLCDSRATCLTEDEDDRLNTLIFNMIWYLTKRHIILRYVDSAFSSLYYLKFSWLTFLEAMQENKMVPFYLHSQCRKHPESANHSMHLLHCGA